MTASTKPWEFDRRKEKGLFRLDENIEKLAPRKRDRTYIFSLTSRKKSPIIGVMDERLLDDVRRYAKGGLSQREITHRLERKGFSPEAIGNAWQQVRSSLHLRTTAERYADKTDADKTDTAKKWALRLFRFGFAGVFLINALVAWLQPQDFLGLMQKSLAVNWLGSLEWLIPIIAINDLALGIIILVAPKNSRPYVYAWTGLWFLAITVVKLTALNIFTS